MMWIGLSSIPLAFIGLWMIFSGIFDIVKILWLKKIHNDIDKELRMLKMESNMRYIDMDKVKGE